MPQDDGDEIAEVYVDKFEDTFSKAQHTVVPEEQSMALETRGNNPVESKQHLSGMVGAVMGGLTQAQRNNIRSYGVYGVPEGLISATIYKYLSKHFGSAFAGMIAGSIGGMVAGIVADKVMKERQ